MALLSHTLILQLFHYHRILIQKSLVDLSPEPASEKGNVPWLGVDRMRERKPIETFAIMADDGVIVKVQLLVINVWEQKLGLPAYDVQSGLVRHEHPDMIDPPSGFDKRSIRADFAEIYEQNPRISITLAKIEFANRVRNEGDIVGLGVELEERGKRLHHNGVRIKIKDLVRHIRYPIKHKPHIGVRGVCAMEVNAMLEVFFEELANVKDDDFVLGVMLLEGFLDYLALLASEREVVLPSTPEIGGQDIDRDWGI